MSVNKDYTENASPKIPQAPDVWTILKQGRIFNKHQTINYVCLKSAMLLTGTLIM